MDTPFVSQQDLTDYLGRDVTADPGALIAVDAACDMVRTIAEQQFNSATSTVTLDGSGTDALLLPERPVTAVRSVLVRGTAVTDFALKDNGVLVRKRPEPPVLDWPTWWRDSPYFPVAVWPAGRQNVVVKYDHGYAASDVPRDVRMVALSIAARLVVQGVAKSETVGDVTLEYSAASSMDLTAGERLILGKYRQVR